jgi:hypothetical protein
MHCVININLCKFATAVTEGTVLMQPSYLTSRHAELYSSSYSLA